MLLKLRERTLMLRLDKHLRTSATNSTSKNVITGNCSLTLNTVTNKNVELVRQNMLDIVKNSNFTADFLLDTAFTYELSIIAGLLPEVGRWMSPDSRYTEMWDETARRFSSFSCFDMA